jgi:hypothetical protein
VVATRSRNRDLDVKTEDLKGYQPVKGGAMYGRNPERLNGKARGGGP